MPVCSPRTPAENPTPDLLRLIVRPGRTLIRRWKRNPMSSPSAVRRNPVIKRYATLLTSCQEDSRAAGNIDDRLCATPLGSIGELSGIDKQDDLRELLSRRSQIR